MRGLRHEVQEVMVAGDIEMNGVIALALTCD
jgi:hypothetical protein